ncbi:MAG: hypothetical protein VB092_05460 [Oscillospiraceae bacterium]|nr:hypothetical protein [Oscillospiraceae bacterium]
MGKRSYEQTAARLRELYVDNGVCTIPILLPQDGCTDAFDAYSVRLSGAVASSIDSFRPWSDPRCALCLVFYMGGAAGQERCAGVESCVRGHYSEAMVRAAKERRRYACAAAMLALLSGCACFLLLRSAAAGGGLLIAAALSAGFVFLIASAALCCRAAGDFFWYSRVFASRIEFH